MEPEHLTEEELVLRYYGEESAGQLAAERHLNDCPECREVYAALERVLATLDRAPVPERGDDYGAQVWQRVSQRLPARRKWQLKGLVLEWPHPWRWAAAGAVLAGLLVAAFFAGRNFPVSPNSSPSGTMQTAAEADPQRGERILLVAMGEYLERSQMVLTELTHESPDGGKGKVDISAEQARAADLVSESRLYRQTAEHTGDTAVSATLDEVDRVLLDVARGPSEISPADLDRFRRRLKDEGILFKIRVMDSQVRTRQIHDATPGSEQGRRAL